MTRSEADALESLRSICERRFGRTPDEIQHFSVHPDGPRRATRRLRFADHSLIATHRLDPEVGDREARVLETLAAGGAPVPAFLAVEEGWLLQEDAGPLRLSQTLSDAAPEDAARCLAAGIRALDAIHRVGREAGLAGLVPPLGTTPGWVERLLSLPGAIGIRAGLPAPALRDERAAHLVRLLSSPGAAFIKWDARPANATLNRAGEAVWFDWEHARRRWLADDFVWLLNDETIPPDANAHVTLLELGCERGEDPHWAPAPWRDYLVGLSVAHLCVRISIALDPDRADLLDRWDACVENDWAGSARTVARLARRGAQLAPESRCTEHLARWFDDLAAWRPR